ncbi:9924_t:CDS:2 [Rhizophagus irregularis]|nr:9924_t:CDS:2 [Rhizophagus irregularis]
MTSSQPAAPSQTANNTITDTTMEEALSSSPTHALSHSEIELTSRDLHEQDIHTQTPIIDKLTNMDVDPINTNTNKGKSPETQSATQTNIPNPLQITVLTDIFAQTPQ